MRSSRGEKIASRFEPARKNCAIAASTTANNGKKQVESTFPRELNTALQKTFTSHAIFPLHVETVARVRHEVHIRPRADDVFSDNFPHDRSLDDVLQPHEAEL